MSDSQGGKESDAKGASRRLLFATDFSPAAARAGEAAATIAHHRNASIVLLHVFEPPSATVPELAVEPRIDEELRERARLQLASSAAALRARGLAVEERMQIGSPPSTIIAEIADELAPDMVVLGSHGSSAVSRLLLGSVAEDVVLRVERPVLLVPPEGGGVGLFPPAPGTAAAAATSPARPLRLAVGLDASNTSAAAVAWARELRKTIACDVVFIHLYWPAAEYTRLGLLGQRDLFEPDPTTIAILERTMTPLIGTLPGSGHTSLRILPSWGPVGERLVETAVSAEADLLVLGSHHRHGLARLWHGSTIAPALHEARLPVLCVSAGPRAPIADAPTPRIRSVVAATDLSELGNRSVAHAYSLVRGERGTVHLVHVHERSLPRPAYAYAPDTAGALTPAEDNALRARLMALVPADAAALGISTDTTIVDGGETGEVICQTAARLDADAIALGSHGRGGLGRGVLGSVAARVIHGSDRPVFVVRHPPE